MQEYIERNKNRYNMYNENQSTIRVLKDYLKETDYVVVKMYETVAQGGSIVQMLIDYKEVLKNRISARTQINELEIIEQEN